MYHLLVQPSRPIQIAEIPSRMLQERLREDPTLPVEVLEWVTATRPMDGVLRVALSHGAACTQGLMGYSDDLGDPFPRVLELEQRLAGR